MIGKLGQLHKEHGLKISAFVLMNNHFHLLMLTPNEDIDRVMYFFMKNSTLAMQKHTGRINKIFGGRYKGCLIDNQSYLLNAYKYILRNPVRAGITQYAQEYAYSSLNPDASQSLPFKIDEVVPLSLQSPNKILEWRWVNEAFTQEETLSIKTGLSKSHFAYQKDRTSRKEVRPKCFEKYMT